MPALPPTFTIDPIDPSILILDISLSQGMAGPPGEDAVDSVSLVVGEIPTGLLNGANTVFTTDFDFVPESLEVFVNGIRQRVTQDYTTTGTTTITLLTSPVSSESIVINYRKV